MKSNLKKISAMEATISIWFKHKQFCNNDHFKECVLSETQVDGIDKIKTEMKMFDRQIEVVFQDLADNEQKDIKHTLDIFENDRNDLKKFLEICKVGNSTVEKSLKEPLSTWIEQLNNYITFLKAALD